MLFHYKGITIIYNNSKNVCKMFWLILFFCGKVSEFLALAMTKRKGCKRLSWFGVCCLGVRVVVLSVFRLESCVCQFLSLYACRQQIRGQR